MHSSSPGSLRPRRGSLNMICRLATVASARSFSSTRTETLVSSGGGFRALQQAARRSSRWDKTSARRRSTWGSCRTDDGALVGRAAASNASRDFAIRSAWASISACVLRRTVVGDGAAGGDGPWGAAAGGGSGRGAAGCDRETAKKCAAAISAPAMRMATGVDNFTHGGDSYPCLGYALYRG